MEMIETDGRNTNRDMESDRDGEERNREIKFHLVRL